MWCVYKIYYGSRVVYIGRTCDIDKRIRQHALGGKVVDFLKVSKIEYCELETESDMNLYELYYILLIKPELNEKDFAKDELTLDLPEPVFKEYYTHLWDTWKLKVKLKQQKKKEESERLQLAKDLLKAELPTVGKEILQQQIWQLKNK